MLVSSTAVCTVTTAQVLLQDWGAGSPSLSTCASSWRLSQLNAALWPQSRTVEKEAQAPLHCSPGIAWLSCLSISLCPILLTLTLVTPHTAQDIKFLQISFTSAFIGVCLLLANENLHYKHLVTLTGNLWIHLRTSLYNPAVCLHMQLIVHRLSLHPGNLLVSELRKAFVDWKAQEIDFYSLLAWWVGGPSN